MEMEKDMEMNYKEMDRVRIMEYIARRGGEVSVEDILSESGAERLRVYSLLFEQTLSGEIEVMQEDAFGAPERVRLHR